MGLKSGSRDAGLDDSEEENEQQTTEEESVPVGSSRSEKEAVSEQRTAETERETTTKPESEPDTEDSGTRPAMSSIPYKLRRDKVNEGREQVPYFLREDVIEKEVELQSTLEELLGENVYKSDYREAAMVVAQRNPELVAEVLREWGYDLERSATQD